MDSITSERKQHRLESILFYHQTINHQTIKKSTIKPKSPLLEDPNVWGVASDFPNLFGVLWVRFTNYPKIG